MSQTSSAPLLDERTERLPLSGLLALAMTGFIAILSETLPAGLLDQIADGMHISQAMAGQWVTAYALGSLLTAIPLVTLTQGWYRRRALLLAIGGAFNELVNSPESIGLHRVMVAMATQNPGLVKMFFDAGPQQLLCDLQQLFSRADALGLLNKEQLGQWLPVERDLDAYFLGPKGFMAVVKRHLKGLGVPEQQSRYEFFGPAASLE